MSLPPGKLNALQAAVLHEALQDELMPKQSKDKPKKSIAPKLSRSALLGIDAAHSDKIHGEQVVADNGDREI
jgi:hypothetical protein